MSLPLLLQFLVLQHHFSIADDIGGFVTFAPTAPNNNYLRRRQRRRSSSVVVPPSLAPRFFAQEYSSDYADLQEVQEKHTKQRREQPHVVIPFVATKTVQTPPLPPTDKSLEEFFGSFRNLLFAAKATVQEVDDPSQQLLESFQRESSLRRAEAGLCISPLSSSTDIRWTRLVRLLNPPMHCIGVTLHSSTYVGMQLLVQQQQKQNDDDDNNNNNNTQMTELQMTLLDTTLDATGPRPLVSLFYKIMGQRDRRDLLRADNGTTTREDHDHPHESSAIQTIGFTRVSAQTSNNHLIFTSTARLESRMRIPALLWKIIPMSKKRMEERGSATLQKAIEKDMDAALERFAKAYVTWIER
jgi:hypothetical protein